MAGSALREGASSDSCMLTVSHLSLAVRIDEAWVQAVRDISFTLHAGRVLALVGESGCGKSLTAQALLRLGEHQGVRREQGDVALQGESILDFDSERLRRMRGGSIAMVFQEPMTALNPVFTVGSQIVDVIRNHLPLSRVAARERAIELLADVEMDEPAELLERYPGELSGGMRQRVLIAMALSADAPILVADEPTTALDVSVQKRILALLRSLQRSRNLALLLVTHDFGVVAEMADEVAVMYAGQIVEQGSVRQIFDHAAHPYTQALLLCRPEMAIEGEPLANISGQVPSPGSWPVGCHFAARCPLADSGCRAQPVALTSCVNPSGSDGGEGHSVRCLHPQQRL
ncbi:MAG: ABC transporter ATP-binding protein [Mariprofundales bacterium]|nr:ABC transporter ATP-binding protein [Mariprofundales bacterium]